MSVKNVISCSILTILVSLLVLGSGCILVAENGTSISGSSTSETREMDFSDFNIVKVGHAFEVSVTKASSFSVSITMPDNLFDYLVIEQSGDILYIGLKPNLRFWNTRHSVTITMPELRGLELSGASRGDISGFSSTDSLYLGASGASILDINNVKAGNTDFDISGASKISGSIEITDSNFQVSGASSVSLEGTAGDVVLQVSGASSMNLEDLTVDNASVGASGASSIKINASGRLDLDLSGASRLYYTGGAMIGNLEMSGASTVKQR